MAGARLQRRLMPPLVLSFIALLSATTLRQQLFYTPLSAATLLSYLTFVALTAFTYLRAHRTAPGDPRRWRELRPDLPHPCFRLDDVEQPHPPLCEKCSLPKPERVHHCSTCDACVLRFDHHCPWLAVCVGLNNSKFFLQFLLFSMISCLFTALLQLRFLLNLPSRLSQQALIFVAVVAPLCLSLSVVCFAATLTLFTWNLWLALRNRTALEHLKLSNGQHAPCYNVGTLSNLRHLLGWNPCLWLVPVHQSRCPPPATKPQ